MSSRTTDDIYRDIDSDLDDQEVALAVAVRLDAAGLPAAAESTLDFGAYEAREAHEYQARRARTVRDLTEEIERREPLKRYERAADLMMQAGEDGDPADLDLALIELAEVAAAAERAKMRTRRGTDDGHTPRRLTAEDRALLALADAKGSSPSPAARALATFNARRAAITRPPTLVRA